MSEIDDAIRYFMEDVEDCENAIRGIKNTLKISEHEKEEIDALRTHADESRMLAEWLKELKQLREQTRWIPSSERYPTDPNKCYLVCYEDDCITIENLYFDGNGYPFFSEMELGVTAWMPLPDPYKASPTGEEVEE